MAFPMTYDEWMEAVDAACWKMVGVSIHDLMDMPFVDWFEDGFSPRAAAKKAIAVENGGDW